MMTALRLKIVPVLVAASVLSVMTTTVHAGPPLICHPVEIGEATCLPWGQKAFSTEKGFRLSRLVDETVRILDGDQTVLVHMETLRRAAIYSRDDANLAMRLEATLMARALDAGSSGRSAALAWFDAGYLAQCYHQLGVRLDVPCGISNGIAGYGWVRRALEIAGDDPELQFGAAMMTALARIPEHDEHVARVRKLADDDSLVARNLQVHSTKYWPHFRR